MRWAVPFLCLAGAAGLWAWAVLWPKEATLEPLPARFAAVYQFAGFDAPPGRPMENPLPPGQAHLFDFRADGTYAFSVMVSGGHEILRREGVVRVSPGGVLTLTPVSTNRREDRGPPEHFHAEWGEDEGGPFLALRHVQQAYTFRLRPK